MSKAPPHDVLGFEMWMLRCTHTQLVDWDAKAIKTKKPERLPMFIAALESFLVHSRNLFAFFFDHQGEPDDLVAEMMLPPNARAPFRKPKRLAEWRERMNKA